MIARLHLQIPYPFIRSTAEELAPWQFEYGEYTITIHPPYQRADQPTAPGDEIIVDGAPGAECDLLIIDFHKEAFDRRRAQGTGDPPAEVLIEVVNLLLRRLRSATQAAQIKSLPSYGGVPWVLEYLGDDGQPLPGDEEHIRQRGVALGQLGWVLISGEIWADLQQLPLEHEPLPWETLILDAKDLLPQVGPAIVLAQTALETMIARVLDRAAGGVAMPEGLWAWITHRDMRLKDPSLDDKFTRLLKIFTGRSLTDDKELWLGFTHLKKARNSFIHQGQARIGDEVVTPPRAAELVAKAEDITEWLEKDLPPELRRYKPSVVHQVSVSKGIFVVGGAEKAAAAQEEAQPDRSAEAGLAQEEGGSAPSAQGAR